MIVEDDFVIGQHIAGIVEDAGASVIGPFGTMIDALENLTDFNAIDGAILDIGLGEQQSYPLAEALQTTGIPFLFLTGVEKDDLPEKFARTPHMTKPFSPALLIRSLVESGIGRT